MSGGRGWLGGEPAPGGRAAAKSAVADSYHMVLRYWCLPAPGMMAFDEKMRTRGIPLGEVGRRMRRPYTRQLCPRSVLKRHNCQGNPSPSRATTTRSIQILAAV